MTFLLVLLSMSWLASAQSHHDFFQCLLDFQSSKPISKVLHFPMNSSYSSTLQCSIQNKLFDTSATPKPLLIVTPSEVSHIQAAILCCKRHNLQIRIRSGGHDYGGLSYTSPEPFIVIDLINFRTITIDSENSTAWIEAGATLGEVYYKIAEVSETLAFPGGTCPTVGVGGLFSGGGVGMLVRKYGTSADNIIDAKLVDARGRFLDRDAMGEDHFWAIRGGGGNTFGVIFAWKVNLVAVPATVTVFSPTRTLAENATGIVHRWQFVADKLDRDLFIRVILKRVNRTDLGAEFQSLFLGGIGTLLPLMQESFPELGLVKQDCTEMTWIESILYYSDLARDLPLQVLYSRSSFPERYFKAKSDYVQAPMPEPAIRGLFDRLNELGPDHGGTQLNLTPYGGRMSDIPESSIPYPHRAGNIYNIQYYSSWNQVGTAQLENHVTWLRKIHSFVTPFVSKSPRAAYYNYRDLDLGTNGGNGSYKVARRTWGKQYFKGNFYKLVQVKTRVDPDNFFRNEQSVPPLDKY